MPIQASWAALAGLLLTATCAALLIPCAMRWALVDHPDERKRHTRPTPIIGGVAMYFGTLAGLVLAGLPMQTLGPVAAGSTLLVVVGIIDDIRGLGFRIRFAVQCVAAGCLIFWGGLTIDSLGDLFGLGPISLGPLAAPFAVFAVVGLVNAVNMLDGLDGLAGGVVVAILLPVFAYTSMTGMNTIGAASLVVIACVLGFLLFNYRFPWRRDAHAFMGDAGSTLLGFLLAWVMLSLFQQPEPRLPPIAILWIVAVPVSDTVVAMWRRHRKGHSIFAPDRDHLHHILQRAGFGVNATVLIIAGTAALFATTAIVASLDCYPQPWMAIGFGAFIYLHNRIISSAGRFTRAFRHLLTNPEEDK